MSTEDCSAGFCGIGNWQGVAEVFDGAGRFLGNGVDQRHVRTQVEDGRTRIDLSFVGPLKFAGHYFIANRGDHRLYQGPANCGYADALGKDGVTANAYWPLTGLTQKFFLLMAPDGQRQLSLALMSRGETLLYAIIGENVRVQGDGAAALPPMVNGGVHDLADDPEAGRGCLYLHRLGRWEGELFSTAPGEATPRCLGMRQTLTAHNDDLELTWSGSRFAQGDLQCRLTSNGLAAWSDMGACVGTYSLYGGRALSGQFHDLGAGTRVWRREVVSADGSCKAVVNLWYRGEERLGAEWGFLQFRAQS